MTVDRGAPQDWHRLFGMLLIDFFTASPFLVEVERDMSQQQQFLDVVIVRRRRGRFAGRLPDGLDDLAEYNLIAFKSYHEALDDWAMKELIGHYVAYRKLVSPSPSELLPQSNFRLYAVCARFPHNLSGQVPWHERQAEVYDCHWGTDTVRIIVVGQLPRQVHNAPLHLFSPSLELVGYGQSVYRPHSPDTSALLGQIFEMYQREGIAMSYTMEDFRRDYAKQHFHRLTKEEQREVLELMPPEQRRELLQSLPAEERLAGLPAEERLAGLPAEERLAGLPEEQIRQYLDRLAARRPAEPRRPRRRR